MVHGAQRRGWVSRHYITVKSRVDVTSTTKTDEAADAEESVFELQPVQSIAAVPRARQVETVNERSTFESKTSVSRADTSNQAAGLAQQSEQSTFENNHE